MFNLMAEIISIGDTSFFGAIFILVLGLVMYFSASYINSGYKPNHEYDLINRQHIDRTLYNNIALIICLLFGFFALIFLTIGSSSFAGHTTKAYSSGMDDMKASIEENINTAFGGEENRESIAKDIKSVGLSEFSFEDMEEYNKKAENVMSEFVNYQ